MARALATVADFAAEDGFTALLNKLLARPERLREALTGGFDAFEARLFRALELAPGATEDRVIAAACAPDAARDARLLLAAQTMLASGSKNDAKYGQPIADWLAEPKRRAEMFDDYVCSFFTEGGAGPRRKDLLTKKAAAAAPQAAETLAREAERLDAVRGTLAAVRTAAATAALFRLGDSVLTHYEHYKRARAALDFGDLITRTRVLLAGDGRGDGRAAWVLWKLDGGIEHVLVDEAQDTSPEQWDLIRRLVEEFFAGAGAARSGPARTLFVVGDFKQSIFSFQGAEPRAFRDMHRHFSARAAAARLGWADVPLNVSFRSVSAVLAAVDKVFAFEAASAGVAETDSADAIRHLTARSGLAGLVEVWPTVRPRDEEDEHAWAESPPKEAIPEPAQALAAEIATRIDGWI
ncbi:MAG: UvrD-helicase domain-containing protein, partial [Alphaproteobacteria bacterium]